MKHSLDRWIDSAKACEILGVHPSTLVNWEKAGTLKCGRTKGGHRRFLESQIRELAPKVSLEVKPDHYGAIAPPIVEADFFDIPEVIKRHARIVQRIQVLIEKRLQNFDPQNLSPKDLIFWLEKAVTIERLCIGLATEHTAHRFTGDVTKLSDEQLDRLVGGTPFAPEDVSGNVSTALLEDASTLTLKDDPT